MDCPYSTYAEPRPAANLNNPFGLWTYYQLEAPDFIPFQASQDRECWSPSPWPNVDSLPFLNPPRLDDEPITSTPYTNSQSTPPSSSSYSLDSLSPGFRPSPPHLITSSWRSSLPSPDQLAYTPSALVVAHPQDPVPLGIPTPMRTSTQLASLNDDQLDAILGILDTPTNGPVNPSNTSASSLNAGTSRLKSPVPSKKRPKKPRTILPRAGVTPSTIRCRCDSKPSRKPPRHWEESCLHNPNRLALNPPFRCDVCGERFLRRAYVQRHQAKTNACSVAGSSMGVT